MNSTITSDGVPRAINAPAANELAKARHGDTREEMPPVFEFPVVSTVLATFYEAGRHDPLPFPEDDD
jgi:hypothetical protein